VWILALVALVNRAGTMVLPFLVLYLTQVRGLSAVHAGSILGLYGVGSVAGSFLGGWLSDRVGTRRAQQISLLGGGAAFLVLGAARHPSHIAFLVLVAAVINDSFRPANMAAFAEHAPPALQPRSFALLRLAINAGMAVGPTAGGLLAMHGYFWLFVLDGVTCWLAALLLSLLCAQDEESGSPTEEIARPTGPPPWRDGPFLALTAYTVALACVFFQFVATLPLSFRELYGLRENAIGLLFGWNALLVVMFEMVVVHRAERYRRPHVIGAGALIVCVGMGMTPLGSGIAFAVLSVTVWTFGEMLSLPLLNVVAAGRATPGNRGRYMGLYTTAFSAALVFAPGLGSFVYERLGPQALWYGVAGLGLPLAVAPLLLARLLDD
jgi:predicted MFS family arabinose efflux permease